MNKRKRRIMFAVLLTAVVVLVAAALSAATHEPEPYVDSWEVAQAMSEEELIAIGQEILVCENGTIPDHAFAVMFRLQEIDPELAEACFRHIDEISVPAQKPDSPQGGLFRSDKPERFGAYVRDGNGGYYEYEEYENSDISVEDEAIEVPSETEEITPYDYRDYDSIKKYEG